MLFGDRSRAESFGAVAELYDQARPSYPPALIDALLDGGAPRVLDVGCGTGIAAALLAQRGCAVLGVEIDPRMAELARAKGLEVEVSSLENWEAKGRTFDLVTAGQSWHWIEPHAGAAKAAAVLTDGGRLGIFWNLVDPPAELHERFAAIYARLAPDVNGYSPSVHSGAAREQAALSGIVDSRLFGPVETATFRWTATYDTASWLAQLRTHSNHQTLPPAQLEALLDAVGEATDAIGGSFELPYVTLLVSARRA